MSKTTPWANDEAIQSLKAAEDLKQSSSFVEQDALITDFANRFDTLHKDKSQTRRETLALYTLALHYARKRCSAGNNAGSRHLVQSLISVLSVAIHETSKKGLEMAVAVDVAKLLFRKVASLKAILAAEAPTKESPNA